MENPFCKYKDIFGKPNTGIHSRRLFGFAMVDTVETIIAAMLISYFFEYPFLLVLVSVFIFTICIHRLFCMQTTFNKIIFPNVK